MIFLRFYLLAAEPRMFFALDFGRASFPSPLDPKFARPLATGCMVFQLNNHIFRSQGCAKIETLPVTDSLFPLRAIRSFMAGWCYGTMPCCHRPIAIGGCFASCLSGSPTDAISPFPALLVKQKAFAGKGQQ